MQYYHSYVGGSINQASNEKPKAEKTQPKEAPKIKAYPDKWHQLLDQYPKVHITTEAQSILIKPGDLYILQESYHQLSANSFLLHSYYNYRQLLLFKYDQTGQYYIGVPGNYSQRLKRLAAHFGFEGFEGGINGGLGYYMKRVEL